VNGTGALPWTPSWGIGLLLEVILQELILLLKMEIRQLLINHLNGESLPEEHISLISKKEILDFKPQYKKDTDYVHYLKQFIIWMRLLHQKKLSLIKEELNTSKEICSEYEDQVYLGRERLKLAQDNSTKYQYLILALPELNKLDGDFSKIYLNLKLNGPKLTSTKLSELTNLPRTTAFRKFKKLKKLGLIK
jgi:hypothetical protein